MKYIALLLAFLASFSSAFARDDVLTYSSFYGGGPEYTVTIEDPSIVSCEKTVPDDDSEIPIPPGSSYTVIFTFTGLKPGETAVSVSSRGPLTGDWDDDLTAVVDEDLKVTLVWPRGLARLDFSRENADGVRDYSLFYQEDRLSLSRNDETARPVEQELIDALLALYEEYDLESWDGFDTTGGEDGESFSLYYAFTGGYPRMWAKGRGTFPEKYEEVMDKIEDLFKSVYEVKRPNRNN